MKSRFNGCAPGGGRRRSSKAIAAREFDTRHIHQALKCSAYHRPTKQRNPQ